MTTRLKAQLDYLNKNDKWDKNERYMNPRDKNFIRHIQVIYKVDKNKAKEIFAANNLRGKKQFGKLKNNVQKNIDVHYGKKSRGIQNRGKFIKPKVTKTKRGKQLKVKVTKTKRGKQLKVKVTKTKRGKQLKVKVFSAETLKRVMRGRIKYPDASDYEIRKGVNSQASQKYRLSRGQKQKYTGRVIIKTKEK